MPSHCSIVFHRWCCMLRIMSCFKPSPYFFLHVILVQGDLNFSCPKNAFPEVVWLFFWPCLHLVVNPLYLFSWSLLLIVDFDSDTTTSCRVFFSWLDAVKDSLIIQHCCLAWTSRPFYVAELTSAFFFSQNVDLTAPNVPAISLMDLFCFLSITIVCFTCMESSFDHMMWVHSNSFQMHT